jgi:hypothetical protein
MNGRAKAGERPSVVSVMQAVCRIFHADVFPKLHRQTRSLHCCRRERAGPCAACLFNAVIFYREFQMKTTFKKSIVLLVLAAFAVPSLSFAAAAYPNNKPRPAHHKSHHKHHAKKSTPAPAQ